MDETKKLEEVVGMRFASQEFFERLKMACRMRNSRIGLMPNFTLYFNAIRNIRS